MLYTLEVKVYQEGELYIAVSEEFMVTGRGFTPQDACEELGQGITLLLETIGREEAEKYLPRLKPVPLPMVRRKHSMDTSPVDETNPFTSELELVYA